MEWLTLSRSSLDDRLRVEILTNACLEEECSLPFPHPAPIEADLVVERTMRGLRVALDRDGLPGLRLRSLRHDGDDPTTAQHLSRRARWVLTVLKRREEILARVGQAVVEVQRAYLDGQAERPVPLTVTAMAAQVGLHPSTVSRVIRQKLMLAPRGVVELASLFGRMNGEAREAVRDLLASEGSSRRLTDRVLPSCWPRGGWCSPGERSRSIGALWELSPRAGEGRLPRAASDRRRSRSRARWLRVVA